MRFPLFHTGQEPIPDPVEFWSERLSSAPDWPINILNRFFRGLEWVFARCVLLLVTCICMWAELRLVVPVCLLHLYVHLQSDSLSLPPSSLPRLIHSVPTDKLCLAFPVETPNPMCPPALRGEIVRATVVTQFQEEDEG